MAGSHRHGRDGGESRTQVSAKGLPREVHAAEGKEAGVRARAEQGYIDRVAKNSDHRYEIHDYKTSRHLPSKAEIEENRQHRRKHSGPFWQAQDRATGVLVPHDPELP